MYLAKDVTNRKVTHSGHSGWARGPSHVTSITICSNLKSFDSPAYVRDPLLSGCPENNHMTSNTVIVFDFDLTNHATTLNVHEQFSTKIT